MHLSNCTVCGRRELRGDSSLHPVALGGAVVLASTCRGCGAELSASTSRVVRRPSLDGVA